MTIKDHLERIRDLVGDGSGQIDPGLCGQITANAEAALELLREREATCSRCGRVYAVPGVHICPRPITHK